MGLQRVIHDWARTHTYDTINGVGGEPRRWQETVALRSIRCCNPRKRVQWWGAGAEEALTVVLQKQWRARKHPWTPRFTGTWWTQKTADTFQHTTHSEESQTAVSTRNEHSETTCQRLRQRFVILSIKGKGKPTKGVKAGNLKIQL